ncbi:MAG: haloacid dehalogenase-like hydrolase [Gemmatimonadaceae bacterium]|jgi:phosphoglycolate phosphatase-like HAD superfamily hydrolase|nr:haloacid dehalogenase-like hydrolase [Gemmatimonadaceae bacterium]
MTVVALFDIDGTLLRAHGAGARSIGAALETVFGTRGPADHRFDGKTDPQIVRELMTRAGIPDDEISAGMAAVLARYTELLAGELANAATVELLPGVPALLDAVERDDALVLGLLTGNIAEGAALKLRAVGLEPSRFVIGAFGSDHHERPGLPPVALARAQATIDPSIDGARLVIIGDTPNDLTCGRSIGARAIGVETGRYGADELLPHDPVAVFADLRDTTRVLDALRGAPLHERGVRHATAPATMQPGTAA